MDVRMHIVVNEALRMQQKKGCVELGRPESQYTTSARIETRGQRVVVEAQATSLTTL